MSEYTISQVYPSDSATLSQIDELLAQEGIRRDRNLDYTCAIYDEACQIIGTGSYFGNTLRCLAIRHSHQGEGLLNELLTHLISEQYQRGNTHLFLYTKIQSARFFRDLGFYEIAQIEDTLSFLENRPNGFSNYLKQLSAYKTDDLSGALVMNANPFTLGHQYLTELAAASCDTLHLFVLSEDSSLVPFSVRKRLIQEGISHLPNVILHDSGPYLISSATFPSYFLKDDTAVIQAQARLDLAIFTQIAKTLQISVRYVGEEPTSQVTGIYNQIMEKELPKSGIACSIVPRKQIGNTAISASTARLAIQNQNWDLFKKLVPDSTYRYFLSPEANSVRQRIQAAECVIHY